MRESQQLFLGLRLTSTFFKEFQHPAIQTKIVQHLGVFFNPIKVCQPIGRKDSIQAVCQRMMRLKAFLYLVAQNFSNIQDQDKKKLNTYSG